MLVMPVVAQLLGAVLLVAGIAVLSIPAALVVAGIILLTAGTLAERSAGQAHAP
jgi:ABC-type transport system involved in cytochrome bd biosynthesis fused ATPase/permease subunit